MKFDIILAIETSFDETAASVVQGGCLVRSNIVASQIPLHARYGGVIPEIAARAHTEAILTVIDQALTGAFGNINRRDQMRQIDAVAVTAKPGLVGSLLVGVSTAKALALAFKKPLIPVDHIIGHVYSNAIRKSEYKMTNDEREEISDFDIRPFDSNSSFDHVLDDGEQGSNRSGRPELVEGQTLDFPIITLVASGGHTELILSRTHSGHQIISQTRDDAAGEAFDKVATLLNLSYPGGPSVSAAATGGDVNKYPLPRGLSKSNSLDFSFSGVKTAVAVLVKSLQKDGVDIGSAAPHIAASFQQSVVDSLVSKTVLAAEMHSVATVGLAGGVAANTVLRQKMLDECRARRFDLLTPNLEYCTDNAAMIGAAAYYMTQSDDKLEWYDVKIEKNTKMTI